MGARQVPADFSGVRLTSLGTGMVSENPIISEKRSLS
jgi:hypothetical protein